MDVVGKGQGGRLLMKKIVELNPGIKPREIRGSHISAAKRSLKNDGIEIFDDGSFRSVGKAYGGMVKKYARGGGVRKVNHS